MFMLHIFLNQFYL